MRSGENVSRVSCGGAGETVSEGMEADFSADAVRCDTACFCDNGPGTHNTPSRRGSSIELIG
jgi:hypothetical protein